jgi:hypothetical protein
MSYTDDWRWPTEQKYLDEELDQQLKERWDALSYLGNSKSPYSGPTASLKEVEHSEKYNKLKQQLDILTEQEKPQSTEQEEKSLNHWESLLALHNSKTGGLTLKTQLQQNEEKRAAREQQYLREIQRAKEQWEIAQEGFDRAKATIEGRLQQHEANQLKTETYLVNNIKRAKETLEGLRTFRSKPRIKLEMEMKPHKEYLEASDKDCRDRAEWEALKAKVLPEMRAWLKKEKEEFLKERDQEEAERKARAVASKRKSEAEKLPEAEREAHYKKFPEDRPVIRQIKMAKKAPRQTEEEQRTAICRDVLYGIIEQVMAAGTQSVSSGPEGCSSVAASPCATKGHVVQDPQ